MKQKAFNIKYLFAAAIFALLALVSGVVAVSVKSVSAATAYELVYADEGKTVISDITVNGDDKFVVDIPEQVVEIGHSAFARAGENLTAVNFAANGKLKSIGDFAFGDTGIKDLVIPEGVTDIGEAAFASCASLQTVKLPDSLQNVGAGAFVNTASGLNVTLPNNPNTNYDESSFNRNTNKPVFISDNEEVRAAIKEKLGLSDGEAATYPVVIKYNYRGSVIDTETRLFGKPYNFVEVDGVWKTVTAPSVIGTVLTRNRRWYLSENADGNDWVAVSTLSAELSKDGVEVIELYGIDSDSQKVFIARNDIVYDGTAYRLDSLSSLLMPISERITPDMTVTIKSFTKPDGTEGALPETVCDAGVYVMEVDYGETQPAEFTINVARKKVNLASYENLFWKISQIGSSAADENLMSSADTKVYLYKDTQNSNKIVPLNVLLSDSDAAAKHYTFHEEKTVRYSVVRSRNAAITVSLSGNEAYKEVVYEDAQATGVGVYTSTATLTADDNYEFELRSAPADGLKRGVTVQVNDGKTATVTKEWYIVDINNWVVDNNSNVYEIATREYGAGRFTIPRLANGDVVADDYGIPTADPVRMTLFYEGNQIGDLFMRDEFDEYLNAGIPAGDYTLNFMVRAIPNAPCNETDGDGNPTTVYRDLNAFNHSVSFTVEKARMRDGYINNINNTLKGAAFTYSFDGRVHLYQDDEARTVSKALEGLSLDRPARSIVWMNSEYDKYYDDVRIEYNLRRSQSDEYFESVDTIDPDVYTVYYRISGKNYLSSLDIIGENEDRNDYYFTVTITREILLPTISAKKFNGEKQIAEIEPNDIYYIIKNEGGVSAGTYEVVLKFRNPACYSWQGGGAEDGTITLDFVIEQAANSWVTELSIQNWITGRYDPEVNKAVGGAKFGNDKKVVIITNDKGVEVYNSATGKNNLKSAKEGRYGLRVYIEETADYTGVSDSIFFQIHKKPGLVWWGTLLIVIGALGIAAGVLVILWKKGVIELLTGKITLAIRTRATVDATIAAVRANKVAEEAKISVEKAKAKERAQQRKAAAEAEKAMPAEEKAAALEAKAKAAAERAERMRAKAEAMLSRAERMREEAAATEQSVGSSGSATETDAMQEAAATTDEE